MTSPSRTVYVCSLGNKRNSASVKVQEEGLELLSHLIFRHHRYHAYRWTSGENNQLNLSKSKLKFSCTGLFCNMHLSFPSRSICVQDLVFTWRGDQSEPQETISFSLTAFHRILRSAFAFWDYSLLKKASKEDSVTDLQIHVSDLEGCTSLLLVTCSWRARRGLFYQKQTMTSHPPTCCPQVWIFKIYF